MERTFAANFGARSGKFVEQRLCLFEIGRAKAFGEPAIYRREEVARFGAAALVAAEPGEARGGTQFPELRLLLLRDAQGFAIEFLGGLGMPLPQQQLAFVPIYLCEQLAAPRSARNSESVVLLGIGLLELPRFLVCFSQQYKKIGHPELRPGSAVSGRASLQKRYPFS